MLTPFGHLTYCTNIHSGESWDEHFTAIKRHFPEIKKELSPDHPMGIGLRLSNAASLELIKENVLSDFETWLKTAGGYVFTMNGFPYGGFHKKPVKDRVHTPDWTTDARFDYTHRLFHILAMLLPDGMDGGISTSPLSYKPWYNDSNQLQQARKVATDHVLRVIMNLIETREATGKLMHLDVEPEPDGILESGREFIEWMENDVLSAGVPAISTKFNVSALRAEEMIKDHLRLCYDICHFAVGYEPHKEIIKELAERRIKVGKIQISAALKAEISPSDAADLAVVKSRFRLFDEPVYLHQVIAKTTGGSLRRYPDLPVALNDDDDHISEWRAHFHVPVFIENFDDRLLSTQDEIKEVLAIQKASPFTHHLEAETYTWEVLPEKVKLPLGASITRELKWIKTLLDKDDSK